MRDVDLNGASVLLDNNSVNRKRKCSVLVLLDAAVVMGIEKREVILFVKRIALNIHPGRIDMCSENVHSVAERLLSDPEQAYGLVHPYGIYLITGLKLLLRADKFVELNISCGFRKIYDLVHAFPLGLAFGKEIDVLGIQFFKFL